MSDLVEVHLLQLPVPLAAAARQHFEELTREFLLIAGTDAREGTGEHDVPAQLIALVEALTAQYGGLSSEADDRLEDAIDRRAAVVDDHVLTVPREAGAAVQALGDLFDRADDFCRQGQHLLTLATPPELVAYRHWYLGQVVDQLAGRPPVAWAHRPRLTSV